MRGRHVTLGALFLGYMGVYLCRKNLAVAVPLLQDAFAATKGEIGRIDSIGTVAYAAGKLFLGPPTDRIGGRATFLIVLALVGLFGGLGGLVPSLGLLAMVYAANRFFGATGWPAMMKVVTTWYPADKAARPITILSLSYVLGGVAALLLARELVVGGWRMVMGGPAIATLAILAMCAVLVRSGPLASTSAPGERGTLALAAELLKRREFQIVCALSFTVTLLRQAFNTWSVDFLKTVSGGSVQSAALQSIGFDLAGAVSIVGMGMSYAYFPPHRRRWLLAGVLVALAVVLAILPDAARRVPAAGPALVALIGLLVYGPFSLLAGVMAVENGGARLAATASGVVDAVGYAGAILAGEALGHLLDKGGYTLGFGTLAAISGVSALLALGLRGR